MSDGMDRAIPKLWWRSTRVKALAIAGGICLLIPLALMASRGLSERSLRVAQGNITLATVQRGLFHDFVPLHGSVVPADTIYLDALVGGQVEKILAQPGDDLIEIGLEELRHVDGFVIGNPALVVEDLGDARRVEPEVLGETTLRLTQELETGLEPNLIGYASHDASLIRNCAERKIPPR